MYAYKLGYATSIPVIPGSQGQEGDAVFCHSKGAVGAAIRLGQFLKGFDKRYRTWNHVGWLDKAIKDDSGKIVDWYVGQAIAKGVSVVYKLSDIAPGGQYEVVPLKAFRNIFGAPINRDILLATLRSQVGVKYGFLTIASEIVNILTPKFFRVDFRKDSTWICSGLYSYGLLAGGAPIQGDVYQEMPAEVAKSADHS